MLWNRAEIWGKVVQKGVTAGRKQMYALIWSRKKWRVYLPSPAFPSFIYTRKLFFVDFDYMQVFFLAILS